MSLNRDPLHGEDLQGALREMREGLQIIDRQWRYVFVNDAAAGHGRRQPEELLGRTMMDCYPGIDQTEMFGALRRCMDERIAISLENRFTYPDGAARHFDLRITPCSVGVMVLSIDVTHSRKVEEQLHQAQKMEAIGRLAGSIAHDFNNLLSVILGFGALAVERLEPIDPIRGDIEAINAAANRAAELTRQLLAFSRRQLLAPKVLDLNSQVAQSERILRRLLGEDVELVTRYDRSLYKVKVDPGQIDQVVMNLAVNARDAMPNGGKLTIETRSVALDASYASEHFDVNPGFYAMLAISDSGIGMDEETRNRIFEPFFTTKEEGKGTGLGLSTVFGIVKQSGGNIWVYSEPGAGTTFKVYLPKADDAEDQDVGPMLARVLTGTETVLLAEDHDDVRRVAAEILRRYGYHVLVARNAGDALLISERRPHPIHLLLSDVVMPYMSGRELAERITSARPETRVLFMSGYADSAVIHHGILAPEVSHVQKPLTPEALALRVREVLDAPPHKSKLLDK